MLLWFFAACCMLRFFFIFAGILSQKNPNQFLLQCCDADLEAAEELYQRRITRIVASDFPKYFAVVTRVRHDTALLGPDGGLMSSRANPQVQAVFPPTALTKPIKVGLQVTKNLAYLCKKSVISGLLLLLYASVWIYPQIWWSRWSPLSLFRQVHLGEGKSEYNPPFSELRAASTWEAVGFCGSHRQTDVLANSSSWLGGWSPFCGDNGRHTAQVREWRSLRCRHLWVGG